MTMSSNLSSSTQPLTRENIDFNLWPEFIPDEQDETWRSEIGDDAEQEFTSAMKSLAVASLQENGSMISGNRTFSFRLNDNSSNLTRLDWASESGKIYSLVFEGDSKLSNLARSEPLKAANELSSRFALTISNDNAAERNFPPELHAIVLRDAFMDEHLDLEVNSIMFADPWTGKVTFETPETGFDRVEADFIAAPVYNLETSNSAPEVAHQLQMSEGYASGIVTIAENWYGYSRQALERLGSEVNAVLSSVNLPLIPEESIARLTAATTYVPSNALHEQLLADPGSPITSCFDIEVFENGPIHDRAINALMQDLETATSLRNGVISTALNEYEFALIEGYLGYYSISPVGHSSNSRRSRQFVPTLALARDTKSLESESSALEFLKGLNRQRANNASPNDLARQANLLIIITQALNELTLARQVETGDDEIVQFSTCVRHHLDGDIVIDLGDGGWHKTGAHIAADKPYIGDNLDNELCGPRTETTGYGVTGCGLTAKEHRVAAEETFRKLGLTDLSALTKAIDEHYRFGGARLKDDRRVNFTKNDHLLHDENCNTDR